jgi:hypothetical protein
MAALGEATPPIDEGVCVPTCECLVGYCLIWIAIVTEAFLVENKKLCR